MSLKREAESGKLDESLQVSLIVLGKMDPMQKIKDSRIESVSDSSL